MKYHKIVIERNTARVATPVVYATPYFILLKHFSAQAKHIPYYLVFFTDWEVGEIPEVGLQRLSIHERVQMSSPYEVRQSTVQIFKVVAKYQRPFAVLGQNLIIWYLNQFSICSEKNEIRLIIM